MSSVAETPWSDPVEAFAGTARTLTRVLTQKAAIAQTPKELVWTLNKAKLYRYYVRWCRQKSAIRFRCCWFSRL